MMIEVMFVLVMMVLLIVIMIMKWMMIEMMRMMMIYLSWFQIQNLGSVLYLIFYDLVNRFIGALTRTIARQSQCNLDLIYNLVKMIATL